MKIAAFCTSNKENERRLPIYPEHLSYLPKYVTEKLFLEKGYGKDFGFSDESLSCYCNQILERNELFEKCDILILPKPTAEDIKSMHQGQILWGWVHCVQQFEIAQLVIDKKITVIAWESMNHWDENGNKLLHIFYKNNELAGYSAIIHYLQLRGLDGLYGPRKKISILGYGSVSRGAIYALQGRGFNNIHVYSQREEHLIMSQNPDVFYYHIYKIDAEYFVKKRFENAIKLIDLLSESDIIVNAVLQNPLQPNIFILNEQLNLLKQNTGIIDISCDENMGFEFARPTTLTNPIISLPNGVTYYSVDHTPSYLWNAASREISRALIPYLIKLVEDDFNYLKQKTLLHAIEIENGIIKNNSIIEFQERYPKYPYNSKRNSIKQ